MRKTLVVAGAVLLAPLSWVRRSRRIKAERAAAKALRFRAWLYRLRTSRMAASSPTSSRKRRAPMPRPLSSNGTNVPMATMSFVPHHARSRQRLEKGAPKIHSTGWSSTFRGLRVSWPGNQPLDPKLADGSIPGPGHPGRILRTG